MTIRQFLLTLILNIFLIYPVLSEDNIDLLIKKHPAVIANYINLNTNPVNRNIEWSQSNILEYFTVNQIKCIENKIFIENQPVAFISSVNPDESSDNMNNNKGPSPLVIFKWEFTIEKDGLYFISVPMPIGTYGFINDENVLVISNRTLTKQKSGKQWLSLKKGKNILLIITTPKNKNSITITSEIEVDTIKKEIIKKLNSHVKEDYEWATTNFIPFLGTIRNGIYPYIIEEINRLNKNQPFIVNDGNANLLKSFILQNNFDSYKIEKFIYLNFPDIYFHFFKTGIANDQSYNSFFVSNNEARTDFLQQLIYDGQNVLAEKYFNQCLEAVNAQKGFASKDIFIDMFYSQRFVSFFKIGRIKEANDILKITQENCKTFPLPRFINGRPEQEDVITLTQSFHESMGVQIKEKIDNYESKPEQLGELYKIFLSLPHHLIKWHDGAASLNYFFQQHLETKPTLKLDFENYCLEKIKGKIEKAHETRNVKLVEEILEQYECITPLPELRKILLDEYFKGGAFLKALSQAYFLYDNYLPYQEKIAPLLVILENFSEIPLERRKVNSNLIKNSAVNIQGQSTTIEKLIPQKISLAAENKSLGRLIKILPLEAVHSQYSDHLYLSAYQPIEPIFTQNNIIFNGAKYLVNFSLKNESLAWDYHSHYEYKKEAENGPHQKRFITEHAGNQLFFLTNRDHSEKKTVKSLDLKGDLLWDMSDQEISIAEEPLCTPLEAQGKLFGLSYSNRETINVISYCVYDSSTGDLISRVPISFIPRSARDDICRGISLQWNTFTHDNHFTKDEAFVYGYSGTGIVFKADANSGKLLWEKGVPKVNITQENNFFNVFGYAPSGYIKIYGNILLCYMPDSQLFMAFNKVTGDQIWKTRYYLPQFIHDRGKSDFLYFSDTNYKSEQNLYKVNPQNGEIVWQTATHGIIITGEGDIFGDKLYLPLEKAIAVVDINTGDIAQIMELNFHPLKIRSNEKFAVVLSDNAAYIFQNEGKFETNQAKVVSTPLTVSKFIEPDNLQATPLSFNHINLEATLKIPETIYTSPGRKKKTQLVKTSKPFHFLLKCQDNLTLFREGFTQKNGTLIPPEIIWFAQYPCYDINGDILYVSEKGRITASNLFTREQIWSFEYASLSPIIRNNKEKSPPSIAVTNQHIALQTENQSIQVLDVNSRKLIFEFSAPIINMIRMEGNYIVTSNDSGLVRCYDITQKGKEIWAINYNHYRELFIDNGLLVFVRTNDNLISFYDLKTGLLKVQASSGGRFIGNRWKLDDSILFASKRLYDAKTGKPLEKYQAGTVVDGGGYIGFFKLLGQEGNYIDNGKEYYFKLKGGYNERNYLFTAKRKGNRIFIFSFFHIETFEIVNDQLVSIDFSSIKAGIYGDRSDQVNMDLFPLDNSLLDIRKDDMYFFRNFDAELKYEKINSFRIENRRKSPWPYSELYPEVEVNENNWISYNGQKSLRKLSYQAFGDESYVYLKFKLTPYEFANCSSKLYISADGILGKISLIWDVDNWNKAQCSFNINSNTESWKNVDIQGNTILFIKFRISGAFPRQFKDSLPNFNIELRQVRDRQSSGLYRIGGAYNGVPDILPWLNYTNDESQTLKNFSLRTSLYENKVNFYPQGDDLILWLNDRRKMKGGANNIELLRHMITLNAKYYCSVNILSALLIEEIQDLKNKQPAINEFSDDFSKHIVEIISRLNKFAEQQEMKKEWIDFALSFWSMEVFPNKITYQGDKEPFSKPYYGLAIKEGSKTIKHTSFWFKNNLLTSSVNRPYIEWILPGLIANFPNSQVFNSITLDGFGVQKTNLGKMMSYTPKNAVEFCNRKGDLIEAVYYKNQKETIKMAAKKSNYYFQNLPYECFNFENNSPIISLSIMMPSIKSPEALENIHQTSESIRTTLENLPTDSNNGLMMIENYLALSGKVEEKELVSIYGKWLNNLRYNSTLCYQALRSIWKRNQDKNNISFIQNIIKESNVPTNAPRMFNLDNRNIFADKNSRSLLGPIFGELIIKPEIKFSSTLEYKTEKSAHKFSERLGSEKGGAIYLASKVTIDSNAKVYVFARADNNFSSAHTSSVFSIWLNDKAIIEDGVFLHYDDDIFVQKVSLNQGDNILLVKINGLDGYKWENYYSVCLGDAFGAPINGLELKAVHK